MPDRYQPHADAIETARALDPWEIETDRPLPGLVPASINGKGGGPELTLVGRYGARMHTDPWHPRWFALLVVHGDGWGLSITNGASEVNTYDSSVGCTHLLDVRSPHALWHEDGDSRDCWIALCWERDSKVAARGVLERAGRWWASLG